MRVANQATLQELAERIDQADAVVIGGGSGLSNAAGYRPLPLVSGTFGGIGSLSRTVWLYLSAGWILPLLFQLWGTVGVLQSIYPLHVGSPYGAALSGSANACCR